MAAGFVISDIMRQVSLLALTSWTIIVLAILIVLLFKKKSKYIVASFLNILLTGVLNIIMFNNTENVWKYVVFSISLFFLVLALYYALTQEDR